MSYQELRWICFDLETIPGRDASAFLPQIVDDYDSIKADGRFTDPVKIAQDLERKRAKVKADADAARLAQWEECSLDWNLSEIVAIGWQTESDKEPVVALVNEDHQTRESALAAFWTETRNRRLIGYRSRTFDAPTLITHSRLLHVPHRELSVAPYGRGDVVDLFDLATFDDMRCTKVMERTLTNFCRRYGMDVPEDKTTGADIARLVQAGEWEAVRHHCNTDIQKTVWFARALGVIPDLEPEPAPVLAAEIVF